MTQNTSRMETWDYSNGSWILAENVNGEFKFFEKEYGGVRWYEITAPLEIKKWTTKFVRRTSAGQG